MFSMDRKSRVMRSINWIWLAVVLAVGCGKPSVELVPATGTVTIDGQPAAGIMVQFMPAVVDETVVAPTSQGLTDAEGKFELYTLQNEPGAVPGPHRVSLYDTEEERLEQGQEATKPRRLDPKYASGYLNAEVEAGEPIQLNATSGQ